MFVCSCSAGCSVVAKHANLRTLQDGAIQDQRFTASIPTGIELLELMIVECNGIGVYLFLLLSSNSNDDCTNACICDAG